MEHLQQLKDFDENLAYEKEARAQEMEQRRRVEVFHFNAYSVCPTLFFVLARSFRGLGNVKSHCSQDFNLWSYEQDNGCARTLKAFGHFSAILCKTNHMTTFCVFFGERERRRLIFRTVFWN